MISSRSPQLAVNPAIKFRHPDQLSKTPLSGVLLFSLLPPNFSELLEVNLIIEYLSGVFNLSLQNLSFILVKTHFSDVCHKLWTRLGERELLCGMGYGNPENRLGPLVHSRETGFLSKINDNLPDFRSATGFSDLWISGCTGVPRENPGSRFLTWGYADIVGQFIGIQTVRFQRGVGE